MLDIAQVHDHLVTGHEAVSKVTHALEVCPSPEELTETLIFMCKLCGRYNADLDLALDNFMVRPHTGEVLVIDPAHGADVVPEIWEPTCAWGELVVSPCP